MILPRNNHELDKVFKDASIPELSEFNGEYLVDMLTGFPSLKCFSHRKVFYSQNGTITGKNVFLNNMQWGRFFLEYGDCKEPDLFKVVVINYKIRENSFISNRIKDYVRCVKSGTLYLARFNYFFMGSYRFWGYFTLEKAA
jgi:hypothetical protein